MIERKYFEDRMHERHQQQIKTSKTNSFKTFIFKAGSIKYFIKNSIQLYTGDRLFGFHNMVHQQSTRSFQASQDIWSCEPNSIQDLLILPPNITKTVSCGPREYIYKWHHAGQPRETLTRFQLIHQKRSVHHVDICTHTHTHIYIYMWRHTAPRLLT